MHINIYVYIYVNVYAFICIFEDWGCKYMFMHESHENKDIFE
jgi:hypothetical protein